MIGRAHFGIVYKGFRFFSKNDLLMFSIEIGLYKGEIAVAIKTTSKSRLSSKEECELNMLDEARTMMNLSHPHLVHFYGISRYNNRLCLVTEYVPNGCLLIWLHQQQRSPVTSLFSSSSWTLFSSNF